MAQLSNQTVLTTKHTNIFGFTLDLKLTFLQHKLTLTVIFVLPVSTKASALYIVNLNCCMFRKVDCKFVIKTKKDFDMQT